jgi:predicted nucleic acid-binding protein
VILDTNALSAIADGDAKIEPFLREASEVAVPVIVLGEFRFGIRRSRGRTQYERWLLESITSYRVLRVEEQTAEFYAEIRDELKRLGRPVSANDLWIAALTRQHGLPLMSRDRHFDAVPGLQRIGW